METKHLKKYAPEARREFIEAVANKAAVYGLLPDTILPMSEEGDIVVIGDRPFQRTVARKRIQLEERVRKEGFQQFIESIAYTWFNRFVAIRYMELREYLSHGYRVLSHPSGGNMPEIMEYAERLDLPGLDRDAVVDLQLDGQKDEQLYQMLLLAQCNELHKFMPFMFEKVSDATELLLPDHLLHTESLVRHLVEGLPPESLEDIEAVGWLYQFYISEKKDDVFAALKKGKKITPENIPAATQLFTPHWIVRYLVENSLGRLWMLNFPESKLVEKMEYYIEPEAPEAGARGQGLGARKGDNDDGSEFQRLDRVAESHGVGYGSVQSDKGVPERGALRVDESGQAGGSIDSVKHSGGTRTEGNGGVQELPLDRKGQSGGSGNTTSHRSQSELFGSDTPQSTAGDAHGNRQDAQQSHQKTSPQSLAPNPSSPQHQETDFLRISSPEELKICDPACGSGHMLTYAFDLLYAIYEEQGYQATDIPRLILTHNLYGIEIDQRAGALAAFALTMKAREKYRRFLTGGKVVQPNICVLENISIDPEDLSAYMDKVGRDLFSGGLQGVVNQWEEADNFGSLIRPLVTDVSEVLELLRERQMGEDLFLAGVHQKVLKALRQADYLSPKYHVVVANPPYVGRRNMNLALKKHQQQNYADVKNDLFAAFIIRNSELAIDGGQLGFMCPFVWMFLSSYEYLRGQVIGEMTITSLVQLEYSGFDGATVPICSFTIEKAKKDNFNGAYIRLADFRGAENQAPRTLEAIQNPGCPWFYRANAQRFREIPGSPLAYWATDSIRRVFQRSTPLSEIAPPCQGMATTDNDRFLRLWHEVSRPRIQTGCITREDAKSSGNKWFPYNKGGSFRKWYGNNAYIIDYANDGEDLKSVVKEKYRDKDYAQGFTDEKWDKLIEVWVLKNQEFYFRKCVTWTATSSAYFGVRHSDSGFIFDVKGSACFPSDEDHFLVLAFLCTKQVTLFLSFLNSTIEFQPRDIGILPILLPQLKPLSVEITELSKQAISITRDDWNNSECSWEFTSLPLLRGTDGSEHLADAWELVHRRAQNSCNELMDLETQLNRIFINAYEIENEIEPDLEVKDVTLTCNPAYRYGDDKSESELEALLLADTMREFISYAVGCMLGRYSLDAPGLILANAGESIEDYYRIVSEKKGNRGQGLGASEEDSPSASVTFEPDADNVIPLLDGDWFEDDITERFKAFLKVTFGSEHYEENLTFLENALYGDNLTGKKRKTIRDYFLQDFFKHHLKLYKKRPIYWLFSSGKQKAFQALIYMHRYNPSTLSRMRTEYVVKLQGKYNARIEQLEGEIPAASSTSRRKALESERTKLLKQRTELIDFDEKLRHYADQRIEIDLDDGVKVNYGKFGDLLVEVKAVHGQKPVMEVTT